MGRLTDKVVIITGAGRGIGREAAMMCAAEGAKVVATDIDQAVLEDTVTTIKQAGNEAIALVQDVADEKRWQEVVETTVATYGKVDVLVNNAGLASPKYILELETAEWKRIQDILLDGCVFGMKYVIPEMQKNGGGSIINVSSIAGLVGMAFTSPYTAAKGALRSLSKGAAVEFGKDKIRVNTIHPGIIYTPGMEDHWDEQAQGYYHTFTQLPYLGESSDIGYGIVYLASDESKFITGSELVIDGGWTSI